MSYLNTVDTSVTIAGTKCHFIKMTLKQGFNSHHTFEIEVNYEELDGKWMENPVKVIKLIGEAVNIDMVHKVTNESNLFQGIITNVSVVGEYGHKNNIIIQGCSLTLRLDGEKTMDSFMDQSLHQIASECISNSGNDAKVIVNPQYTGQIEYLCQYEETAFSFLNRLSWLYGEWFYYDGVNCYFGKPETEDEIKVTYDIDITHFSLNANLLPSSFKRYIYMSHLDKEMDSITPESVEGVRGYIKVAADKSREIFTSPSNLPMRTLIKSKPELNHIVDVEKSRSVSSMLTFTGESQTCKIKIGRIVDIVLPQGMDVTVKDVEKFLITEVTHYVDQEGKYSNSFLGVPASIKTIPMKSPKTPVAYPEIATVVDNSDNLGRIKVQYQWQKEKNKTTNWIKVQTPDAGKSDKVSSNRGLVLIPEVDDMVMTGFEFGDSSRPYSAGSIFTQTVGKGGGQGNRSKSLTTRSGCAVILDDAQGVGSATVKDPSGNTVFMDGAGNVFITAPNTVTITATDIVLNGGNSIQLIASPGENGGEGNISLHAMKNISNTTETEDITLTAQRKIEIKATDETISTEAKQNITTKSAEGKVDIAANKDASLKSDTGKIDIAAKTDINLEAPTKIGIKTPDMNIS